MGAEVFRHSRVVMNFISIRWRRAMGIVHLATVRLALAATPGVMFRAAAAILAHRLEGPSHNVPPVSG